jgi:hypothetical protein
LEVLIALALIALALPLLISPFVYMATDLREEIQTSQLERIANLSLSSLLVGFHTKKIPLTVLESDQSYPVPFEWYKDMGFKEDEIIANYRFAKKNENKEEGDKEKHELWEVTFAFQLLGQKNPVEFKHLFLVEREQAV